MRGKIKVPAGGVVKIASFGSIEMPAGSRLTPASAYKSVGGWQAQHDASTGWEIEMPIDGRIKIPLQMNADILEAIKVSPENLSDDFTKHKGKYMIDILWGKNFEVPEDWQIEGVFEVSDKEAKGSSEELDAIANKAFEERCVEMGLPTDKQELEALRESLNEWAPAIAKARGLVKPMKIS
jgi:hypothetical protein